MSYRDIRDHLAEMYGLDISPTSLSAITDKIIPKTKLAGEKKIDKKQTGILKALGYIP